MLMATFGDIHGNLPALEAVLDAIDDAGIQTMACLGDCVGGHPFPNEVIALLRKRNIPTVQGEWDRSSARFLRMRTTLERTCSAEELEALGQAHAAVHSHNIERLAALPRRRVLTVDGIEVYVCHGSPQGQTDGLTSDGDVSRFRRSRETANTPIVVCGHTHQAFARRVDGTLFVNPGAVSEPFGHASVACYALVDTEREPWSAHFHHVQYGD